MQNSEGLTRSLKSRHIQLIALGGTIGVGLFLGSAGAIHKAGPGLLLSYAIGGIAILRRQLSRRVDSHACFNSRLDRSIPGVRAKTQSWSQARRYQPRDAARFPSV